MSSFRKVEMSSTLTHSKGVCDGKREDRYYGCKGNKEVACD